MNPFFADTFYYLALLNEDDEAHAKILTIAEHMVGRTVTTAWVLTEVADALAAPGERGEFMRLLETLRASPRCTIVPAAQDLFDEGVALYGQRSDKEWSLTDCISFVVMREHGITDALTGDHHFEQAGFKALLKLP
jgi:hypothetical protein